jgi:hypothetical protein
MEVVQISCAITRNTSLFLSYLPEDRLPSPCWFVVTTLLLLHQPLFPVPSSKKEQRQGQHCCTQEDRNSACKRKGKSGYWIAVSISKSATQYQVDFNKGWSINGTEDISWSSQRSTKYNHYHHQRGAPGRVPFSIPSLWYLLCFYFLLFKKAIANSSLPFRSIVRIMWFYSRESLLERLTVSTKCNI